MDDSQASLSGEFPLRFQEGVYASDGLLFHRVHGAGAIEDKADFTQVCVQRCFLRVSPLLLEFSETDVLEWKLIDLYRKLAEHFPIEGDPAFQAADRRDVRIS
jgi:hypothetical protein